MERRSFRGIKNGEEELQGNLKNGEEELQGNKTVEEGRSFRGITKWRGGASGE